MGCASCLLPREKTFLLNRMSEVDSVDLNRLCLDDPLRYGDGDPGGTRWLIDREIDNEQQKNCGKRKKKNAEHIQNDFYRSMTKYARYSHRDSARYIFAHPI